MMNTPDDGIELMFAWRQSDEPNFLNSLIYLESDREPTEDQPKRSTRVTCWESAEGKVLADFEYCKSNTKSVLFAQAYFHECTATVTFFAGNGVSNVVDMRTIL